MTFVLQSDHAKFPVLFRWVLAAVWSSGLVLGIFFFYRVSPSVISLMRGCTLSSVSIVGVLFSTLFPFLISAFAVLYSKPSIVFGVCFYRAFAYMTVSCLLLWMHNGEGWLQLQFLMVHEILSLPVLYSFVYRCFRIGKLPGAAEFLSWIGGQILLVYFVFKVLDPLLVVMEIL